MHRLAFALSFAAFFPLVVAIPDSEGDIFLDPFDSDGVIGLSCPKTDLLETVALLGSTKVISWRVADLSATCAHEDDTFQGLEFRALFSTPEWEHVLVLVGLDSNGMTTSWGLAWNTGPLELQEFPVDYWFANNTVEASFAGIDGPWRSLIFTAKLPWCENGSCRSDQSPLFADRVPDFGSITVEEG